MNNILSDFYYGNIIPNEKRFVRNSEFGKAAKSISESEEQLRFMLNEQELALLDKLISAQLTMDAITAEENFIYGFKIGAKFAFAITDGERGDTRPITE